MVAGITRLGLAGISRPKYRFGIKAAKPVEIEGGASTASAFVRDHLREVGYYDQDRAWQRAYNRRERARRAAEAAAETEKPAAKREAKRIYREIKRGEQPETPTFGALAETIGAFAPKYSDNLALPPEKAVKFDQLVSDVEALQTMYEAYFEQREREMIAEENALLGVFLAAA